MPVYAIQIIMYERTSRSVICQGGPFPSIGVMTPQEALDCVRVRYVPTADFRQNMKGLSSIDCRQGGGVKVVMEPVTEVPREPNGKFRVVICRLSQSGIADFLGQGQSVHIQVPRGRGRR
jgi:hypothetical protein